MACDTWELSKNAKLHYKGTKSSDNPSHVLYIFPSVLPARVVYLDSCVSVSFEPSLNFGLNNLTWARSLLIRHQQENKLSTPLIRTTATKCSKPDLFPC